MSRLGTTQSPAFLTQSSLAISGEATDVAHTAVRDWLSGIQGTVRGGAAVASLMEVLRPASQPDWDHQGALAVASSTGMLALGFLASLPEVFPLPEVDAEPDGRIAFDWYRGPRGVLTVSIGKRNSLAYAATIGSHASHGTVVLGDSFPAAIVDLLRGLYPPTDV